MEETKTEPGQPDAAADATACDWSRVGYRWGLLFLVMGGGFFVGATLLATGARRAASNGDGRRGGRRGGDGRQQPRVDVDPVELEELALLPVQ